MQTSQTDALACPAEVNRTLPASARRQKWSSCIAPLLSNSHAARLTRKAVYPERPWNCGGTHCIASPSLPSRVFLQTDERRAQPPQISHKHTEKEWSPAEEHEWGCMLPTHRGDSSPATHGDTAGPRASHAALDPAVTGTKCNKQNRVICSLFWGMGGQRSRSNHSATASCRLHTPRINQ